MGQTSTRTIKQILSSHHTLIGAPLLLVIVFCFSFVLLQPAKTDPTRAAANQSPAPEPTRPADSAATGLATIPLAEETSLPTLEQAAPADDSLAAAARGTVTGTPQSSTRGSTPKSANPQGVAGRQQIGPNTVIQVSTNGFFKSLTNLLP